MSHRRVVAVVPDLFFAARIAGTAERLGVALELPAPDEWLRRLGELPLMFQPGERWMYNTGSDALGVLISRCSGQSLPTFLEERLFQPLGMKDTGFSVPGHELDRLVVGYGLDFATRALTVIDAAEDSQWGRQPAFPSGAGGLVSTLSDFFSFAQMLLRGGKHGGERILSRAAVELMTSDQLTPAQKARIKRLAKAEGTTAKEAVLRLVDAALEEREQAPRPGSFLDGIEHLVGSVDGPADLSTNPEHMRGYGR